MDGQEMPYWDRRNPAAVLRLQDMSPFSRSVTIIRHFQEHRHFLCRIRSDCGGRLASFDEAPTNVVANMPSPGLLMAGEATTAPIGPLL
jgi:hypothetical protein